MNKKGQRKTSELGPKHNGANTPSVADDRLERILDEFTQRHRRGDNPSVEQYAREYPEYAADIHELFPAILTMERLGDRKRQDRLPEMELPLERLGDFRVIGEIARGGMGIVYEAEQVTLGRRVAVKVLPKQILRGEKSVRRFQREAKTAAKLHHSNIVPVFGVGEQDNTHYIVMQLIRGVGLDEILVELKRIVFSKTHDEMGAAGNDSRRSSRIKRNVFNLLHNEIRRDSHSSNGVSLTCGSTDGSLNGHPSRTVPSVTRQDAPKTDPPRSLEAIARFPSQMGKEYYRNIARIGLQVASALGYAHKHGTLHRDVKPGNLLLDDEGVVWIADFGLAKAMEQDDITWSGDVVGTLSYMAPERFEGVAAAKGDIYGLALTLYELITFERAFDGTDRVSVMHRVTTEELLAPRKLNPEIPRDLETIVLKGANRDARDRYSTAEDMADDLERFLDGRPIQARRMALSEQFVRWSRANRAVAALAASVLMLIATVLVVTVAGYVRETTQRQRAEATSRLAVAALDKIYDQFAPARLHVPASATLDGNTEEGMLAAQSQLPLSKDIALLLENLLTFYDDLSQQSVNGAKVVVKSIEANRRVADIHHRLGELEKARIAYQRAAERIKRIDQKIGQSRPVRLESARIHNGLGLVLAAQRDSDGAIRVHENVLDLLDPESESAIERYEFARTLYLLHRAETNPWSRPSERKPAHEIERVIRNAVSMLAAIVEKNPNVPEYKFLLARCYLAIGTVNRHISPSDKEFHAKGIHILHELVKDSPDVPEYRFELGDAYANTAWRTVWKKEGASHEELTSVNQQLEDALEISANLDVSHPNIPKYNLLKSRLHSTLATNLERLGRLTDAEAHYEKALEKHQLVVRQSLEPFPHEVWMCQLRLSHAQLQRDLGKLDRARVLLEDTAARFASLIASPPANHFRFSRHWAEKSLSKTQMTLSDVLLRLGEQEEAEKLLREAQG